LRKIVLNILILWSVAGWTQQNVRPDSLMIESRNDSIDLVSNFYDLYDSLTHFRHPSDFLYSSWNTASIRYKEGDTIKRPDSVRIVLVDIAHGEKYVHPFCGDVTSRFGYRRYRFHYGTDIDLITGDPVRCAFDGMVRATLYDRGYGKVVVVRHNNGLETVYAHLSKVLVDSNTVVKAGDIIGYGGNTGRSTGSHLHFEIRYLGAAVNPETIVDFVNYKLIADTIYLTQKNFEYLRRIAADKNAKYHRVRKGDTLSAIARRYHTSVNKLCYLNGIKQTHILQIGEKIRVR
jgi:murein DD-endopeptidase MepM/ murein hydrolase activator NlpD